MAANAFLAATVLFLALAFYLLDECRFLIPYRDLLIRRHGASIAAFGGVLFVNLFAAVYFIARTLCLKDTGRKLAHFEKQVRSGDSLSDELTRRLNE